MRLSRSLIQIAFISVALLGFSGSIAAQESPKSMESVVTCPAELTDLRLDYTVKYTPPRGWAHADAYARAKKGGSYSGLTLVVNSHEVRDNSMICSYAKGTAPSHFRLASIRKVVPKGTVCKAEPDYRFRCVTNTQ